MKKRMIIGAVCLSLILSANAYAAADSFDSVMISYGEKGNSYVTNLSVDGTDVLCVSCDGKDSGVFTETNVRTLPSASSEKAGTITSGASVKIWGHTNNGWCKVYCEEAGIPYFGYIRADLVK